MGYGSSQYLVWKCSLREKMAAYGWCTQISITCGINKTVVLTIITYTPTAIEIINITIGHHKGRKCFIYGMAAIQRGNQLLIILSLVCKFCINLVHVAMPNRCWKRQFMNRNTRGRRINAEAFSHTIFFWYEMIIVNARHRATCAWKGQAN